MKARWLRLFCRNPRDATLARCYLLAVKDFSPLSPSDIALDACSSGLPFLGEPGETYEDDLRATGRGSDGRGGLSLCLRARTWLDYPT